MRSTIKLMKNWQFTGPDGKTAAVDLPHTWNNIDGQDGGNDYWRGTCTYTTRFAAPAYDAETQQVWLQFEGVNASARVTLNGQEIMRHDGGYSTFRAEVTGLLAEENELTVAVDNSKNDRVYPQKADFTFYGGIYRDVNLLVVSKNHIALDYLGSCGVQITPTVNGANADITVKTRVEGEGEIEFSILDAAGAEGLTGKGCDASVTLAHPHLWDGVRDPYLYTCAVRLVLNGAVQDEVRQRFGVRSFHVDPQKGFFLNGRAYPLHGVSRHQDRLYKGNALTAEDHYEDAQIIKDLGANTIRLAHYQHSQDFYDACDQLGFAVWAEIPFISVFKPGDAAHEHCRQEMKELVIQNYNHPSIMFWGISNEILIGGISQELVDCHHDLQKLCKELDPTRLTTIAHVSQTPTTGPMHRITDVESYNHYFGWYGGKIEDNGPWLDKFHAEHPDICLGVSEYGCEGIVNWHSSNPQRKDYSEEYQTLYHEHMAQVFEERPWVWATHVWNMFDFGCAARNEGGVGGRNNKGLVTIDRKTRKESFYLYQAYWSQEPMVHIVGRRYAQRAGETIEVKVYSNQDEVTLFLNGKVIGKQQAHRIFRFEVALQPGFNTLMAITEDARDCITLEKVEKEPASYVLPEFTEHVEGVANWFQQVGSLDLDAPMEFPEGYYNVNDSLDDLAHNEEAFAIVTKAVKLTTNFSIEPGVGMWDMLKKMSPKVMCEMMPDSSLGDKFLNSINAQLIKIKK